VLFRSYEADEGVICAACHTRISASVAAQLPAARFTRALAFGVGAATIGAAIYFAVLAATGRDVSVVVLLVGFLVGKAVRLGARGRGGRRYQWLAVGLTYLAIATTYVPFVLKGFSRNSGPSTSSAAIEPSGAGTFLLVGAPPVAAAPSTPSSLGATTVDLGALILLAVVAPVLEGTNNLVTLSIFALALVLAWRMNRRTAMRITGPFRVRMARI